MLPVKDREASIEFFTRKLGFEVADSVQIRDRYCTAIRVSGDAPLLVLEETDDQTGGNKSGKRIVLNTDDCLRDYYRLKSKGVQFLSKPEYLSVGLSVQFADPSGNIFSLFEQRDYKNN